FFFFFLIKRPPPKSTLFPHPTLFRSGDHDPARSAGLRAIDAAQLGDRIELDRKSTRLNSSHTVISYAVFWLKKKVASNRFHVARPHLVSVGVPHPAEQPC